MPKVLCILLGIAKVSPLCSLRPKKIHQRAILGEILLMLARRSWHHKVSKKAQWSSEAAPPRTSQRLPWVAISLLSSHECRFLFNMVPRHKKMKLDPYQILISYIEWEILSIIPPTNLRLTNITKICSSAKSHRPKNPSAATSKTTSQLWVTLPIVKHRMIFLYWI